MAIVIAVVFVVVVLVVMRIDANGCCGRHGLMVVVFIVMVESLHGSCSCYIYSFIIGFF